MVKFTEESQVRLILENDCILRQPIDSGHITCSGIYIVLKHFTIHILCVEKCDPNILR